MIRSALLLSAIALAAPLLAHHTFSSEFDLRQPLNFTGRIQNVTWSEPHAMITINVAADSYRGDWKLEAASPATLSRRSFTQSMLKTGDSVTVEAYRAKDNSMTGSLRAIKLPDGRWYSVSDPSEDGGPAPQMVTSSTSSSTGTKSKTVEVAANQAPGARPDVGQPVSDGELPATASYIPWFAIAGFASLIFAGSLSRWRAV